MVADQATKRWALAALEPGEYHPIIGDLLGLRLVFNPGAALSMLAGRTWIVTTLMLLLTIGVTIGCFRTNSRAWRIIFASLIGGGVGNLIDRFFAEPGFFQGHVVDMIDYAGFFVGNVADIAIVLAAVFAIVLVARGSSPGIGESAPTAEISAETDPLADVDQDD